MTWLAERSVAAVRTALATVAPELADAPIELHDGWVDTGNPFWSRSSAFVDDAWVVKFAWSEPAARKLLREVSVIRAIGGLDGGPRVARVHAWSAEPSLFVTRFEPGAPLTWHGFAEHPAAMRRRIIDALAETLAAVHDRRTLEAVRQSGPALPEPTPQADTSALRERLAPLLDPARAARLCGWCDWVDAVLAAPTTTVLLHGDFHGYNLVMGDDGGVRRVLDLEEASIGDHHYDFRYLPAQEASLDLLRGTIDRYATRTGRAVSVARVMAWHIRTACGDALWRTEARVPLPGGGTPSLWIDEIEQRLVTLGVRPSV